MAAAALAIVASIVDASGASAAEPTGRNGSALAAPSGTTTGKEGAKRLFEEGFELEKKGDFASALQKYGEAETLAVTAGLLFHKAYCLEMTGKPVQALDAYVAADALAIETNKADVRQAIAPRKEWLEKRTPSLALRIAESDASAVVRVDGQPAGVDGAPMRVNPGKHVITASLPDRELFVQKVLLPAEATTTTVDIALVRHAEIPSASTEPPREEAKTRSYTLPIVTSALTVGFVAAGVTTFVLSGQAQSDAEGACATQPHACDEGDRAKVRTLDAIALGSFVAAVAAGTASVVLFATTKPSSSRGQAPRTSVVARGPTLILEGVF